MRNTRLSICLLVAVMFMSASHGFGNTYFDDGGIHNLNYTINDRVWVDYSAPTMQTTVNLLKGGFCWELDGYNNSKINMFGGSLYNNLVSYDNSQATMSGGVVQQMYAARGNSKATMSGGTVTDLYAYDSGQITMSQGSVKHFFVVKNNGRAMLSGGSILELVTCDSGQLTISGGAWTWLEVENNSYVTIKGSNFAINGTPVNFGEITSLGVYPNDSFRRLTGILANGDIIDNQFRISGTAKLLLVPEPATLLLLGLGGVILRKKR